MWEESEPGDATATTARSSNGGRSEAERMALIQATLEAARPAIQRDGGDLELVSVDGDFVRVRLSGACTTCSIAGQTLGGLRRQLVTALGEPVRVVPAVN